MSSNTFSPTDVASVAVKIATQGFVLSGEVFRDAEAAYRAGTGHVAKVVVPGAAKTTVRDANAYGTAIPASNLQDQTVDVVLKEAHARAIIGDTEQSLDIEDFAAQVVSPLALSVADACEAQVAGLLNAVSLNSTITYTGGTDLPKAITSARSTLRANGVPVGDEIVAFLGTSAYAAALDSGLLEDSDAIRRVRVVECDRMTDPDDVVIAAPKRSFALSVKAPEVPDSVTAGASIKDDEAGFAIRWLESFDASIAASTALASALVGAVALPLPVFDPATGTVTLKPGAAALRFTRA